MRKQIETVLVFLAVVIPFAFIGFVGGILLAYQEATDPWNEDNQSWEE